MGSRLAWYAGISTGLAATVILSAFNQRANFYSACVYLAQSNLCLMILINLILFIFSSFMYGLQRLCYGPLRPIEIEQLYEKAWFAITETCLAMTIFREEVGAWFLVMFVALLTGKVWGWIGDGRVEILEQQPPANPKLFHIRLSISLAVSVIYDAWLMSYTINTVIQQARPNMMVMFLFEFAVLTVSSSSTACRYLISVMEMRVVKKQTEERLIERKREVREERAEMIRQREIARAEAGENYQEPTAPLPSEDDVEEMDIEVPGWEAKGQWVLTLDLITDFMKLSIYSSFFFILFTFYGLPIHIMRDLFVTARSFVKRLTAFLRYRRATHDMNSRYEDATVEDIQREDTCIICREEMRPWSVTNPPVPAGAQPRPGTVNERTRPKKLPCGHILHLGCLKSWLERQQVCPTCRSPVVETPQNAQANANQNARANQPAPGQQDGPAGAGPVPAPARGRGMRMLNLGPIRVGFGQANLNDFAALQNPPGGQANAAGAGPRVYGLELGIPRRAQPQAQPALLDPGQNAAFPLDQLPQHLEELEQQVAQEIRNLQLSQQQLLIVQLLQNELTRLRNLQNNAADPLAANFPLPQMPGFQNPPQIVPPFSNRPSGQSQVHRHSARSNTSAIPSGSADLPPGVVIPEGWSLLPLERLPNAPLPGPAGVPGPAAASTSNDPIIVSASTQNVVSPTIERSEVSNNSATPINTEQVNSQADSVGSSEINAIETPPSISADQSTSTITTSTEPTSTNTNPFVDPPSLPNWGNSQLFTGSSLAGNHNLDGAHSVPTSPPHDGGENTTPHVSLDTMSGTGESTSSSAEHSEPRGDEDGEMRRREKGKAKAVTVEDTVDEAE
ncbi:putative e3 ubiquitin-protein ligase hrd1 protein [Botrytis cinerea BcDW1]|uniref:RING-type E3 ubiquitin transferase n=1 Tax=Botryotinia fuckeliana (strain BcDW1) TaxID=1290391 RepID=M7TM28_BOTF1|nr:putative e3 ubiquitin-protein ligase hrd1 protein [Botrytis cinerea BcDW1]